MLSSTTITTTTTTTTTATLPQPLHLPRRSLLLLTTTTTLSFPSLSTASPPPKQPDTTITDRVFMDFSICPSFFQTRTLGSDLAQCPDSEPVGRIVLGLYGNLVPITVSNFKSMCTGASGYYKGTMIQKLFPGQFFMAGRQGRRDKGEVKPPVNLLRNTETIDPKAFQLGHTKGGILSLCLSENDDDDDIKLDPNYHNVEFMITTGPGPCPDLDGRNIVFGLVLEVMSPRWCVFDEGTIMRDLLVYLEEATRKRDLMVYLEDKEYGGVITKCKRERVNKHKGIQQVCMSVNVKRKATEDKNRREKTFVVDEALNGVNSRASSFQVRGNDEDKKSSSLKRPLLSNNGRHYFPNNGRHYFPCNARYG